MATWSDVLVTRVVAGLGRGLLVPVQVCLCLPSCCVRLSLLVTDWCRLVVS